MLIYIKVMWIFYPGRVKNIFFFSFLICTQLFREKRDFHLGLCHTDSLRPCNTLTAGSLGCDYILLADVLSCHSSECWCLEKAINLIYIFAFADCKFPFYRSWPYAAVNSPSLLECPPLAKKYWSSLHSFMGLKTFRFCEGFIFKVYVWFFSF